MLILKKEATVEIEVRKSRFIAHAIPITSLDQIKGLVQKAREEHPQAVHVVHAAVVGPKGDLYSFSDDREPRNTAGRPAFEVLKGSGITNILILIIRYFGGILLGTGGLVKAYGQSVRELLPLLETEELIEKTAFRVTVPYNLYELLKLQLVSLEAEIESEEFTTDVTITATLPATDIEDLNLYVRNLTNGGASLIVE
ncbi:MAG TPA: YigZ family protein [Sphaerochaeta sp.]|nr:YigZ family protein [Sphaerochaeta sp.]HOR80643.1 YigZ family protein [Sphaerochaeta sp.]HPK64899.1 YigZ family protein [Sphaerochaeta sp.]